MLKRVISLILSLVMILGMMPVNLTAAAEEIPAEDISVAETTAPTEEETVPTEAEPEETVSEETVPEVTIVTGEVQTEYADTYDATITTLYSGSCGSGVSWRLTSDYVLTISGSGAMTNWDYSSQVPWYNRVSSIYEVVIRDGVTSVGDYAFFGCNRLTKVTLPAEMSKIGEYAFYNCTALTGITIPRGVTSISDYAFYNCMAMTSINIPYGVTSIGKNAFRMNNKLTSVVLPESVTHIGTSAFDSCEKLASIYIPSGVTSIDDYAFYGCAFTSFTWPANVAVIPASCFSWCKQLKSVVIPEGVTTIERNAFNECSLLSTVSMPDSLTTIGEYAFRDDVALAAVELPKNVSSIASGAFGGCISLKEIAVAEENPNLCLDISGVVYSADYDTLVVYPCGKTDTAYTVNAKTKTINDGAFYGCTNLKGVVLPAGLTVIGKEAFSRCENITSLNIPASVTAIGKTAFYDCKFAEVVIPEGLSVLNDEVFLWCENLTSITIPKGVTSIGYRTFGGCSNLKNITFKGDAPAFNGAAFGLNHESISASCSYPAGNETWTEDVMQDYGGTITWVAVENYLAEGACGDNLTWTLDDEGKLTVSGEGFATWSGNAPWYDYRDSVKTVVLGDGVTGIVSNAFSRYGNLKCVQLSDTVEYIGPYAFAWCENLTDVTMGSAVAEIGEAAFRNCGSLTYITIPATVRSIGMNAFAYCEKLSGITVDEANTYYSSDENGVLFNEAKTRLLNCPGALTGTYTIPDSVTEIATCAFSACVNLTGVEIPDSVRVIESYAFDGCTGLTEIAIPASVTTLGTKIFDHCAGLQKIRFEGNAPKHFAGNKVVDLFGNTTATVYYPADDATWTEAVRQNYGGTITWKPYCVGEHTEVIDEAVEATCTSDGKTEGKHCSACGEVLVAQEVIPAGHTEVIDESVDATCTTDGKTEGKHCSACGEVLVAQEVIPGGHTVENGICTKCEKYGTCGENLTWAFNPATGTLAISGSGKMVDYEFSGVTPWAAYKGAVKNVVLPEEVTRIGEYAFADLTALTDITVPDSVVSIGESALHGCNSLKNVDLGDGCSLGEGAFWNCPVEKLELGESASFGEVVFNSTKLTSITISADNASFDDGAFWNCGNLKEVHFTGSAPERIKEKGIMTGSSTASFRDVIWYYDCTQDGWTTSSYYNAAMKTWAGYTLISEKHATVIDEAVEATCTSDGKTEGKHCSVCGEVLVAQEVIPAGHTVENGICIRCEKYGACGDNLTWILSEDGVLTISGIGTMWDYSNSSVAPWQGQQTLIKTLVIENGITHIGDQAFLFCRNVTNVTIPDSVISIGAAAFGYCSGLTSIDIPDSVTSIDGGAFTDCGGLTSLTISKGITSIDEITFAGLINLTSVTIPESVTSIGKYAFSRGRSLTSIHIPDSVIQIGEGAFAECGKLTEIIIPQSVTSIATSAFYKCSSLSKVYFKGNAPSFGDSVFSGVVATAYYPLDNETWTDEVRQNYGGTIAWVGYRDDVATVNDVGYGSLEDALAAAKPGDVVKLCKDIAADTVIVHEGITLDLNGYTLEADYIFAVNGSAIVDKSEENTGLLKTDANHVMISKNNEQLPIWNGEGYVFTTVHFLKALLYHDNNKVQYAFLPQFKKVATDLMKDGFEGNMVTVEVRVSWETKQGREYRNLVFNNDQVALGISSGGAFILTFSGFSQLNLTTDVAIEAVVYSETGVSVVSEAIVVDVTGE